MIQHHVNGADGRVAVGRLSADPCCPPLCVDPCVLACSFINLLPSGPMWDQPKIEAISRVENGEDLCPANQSCLSLVNYAVYLAKVLHDLINTALWPSIRESNPVTAVTTLTEWLDRLGWQDCFNSFCLTPALRGAPILFVDGLCGPEYYPVAVPEPLKCAVDRAIVRAILRTKMGPPKNVAGINWVIEPLGAIIRPLREEEACRLRYPGMPSRCYDVQFVVCNSGTQIEACGALECHNRLEITMIDAFFNTPADAPASIPDVLWPGVMAAECIVRSMLPDTSNVTLHNCFHGDTP